VSRQTKDDITELKDKYIGYYREAPIQKYAAMFIGRTEQTVIEWCKNDIKFFNQVQEAKALWVKKQVYKTKAEFALERLEKEIFGKDSIALDESSRPIPILGGISVLPKQVPPIALVEFIGKEQGS
jgi:hypothetical protein